MQMTSTALPVITSQQALKAARELTRAIDLRSGLAETIGLISVGIAGPKNRSHVEVRLRADVDVANQYAAMRSMFGAAYPHGVCFEDVPVSFLVVAPPRGWDRSGMDRLVRTDINIDNIASSPSQKAKLRVEQS